MALTFANLSRRYRITSGDKFRLKHFAPDDDSGSKLRKSADELLDDRVGVEAGRQSAD